jgi:hypothetical protein
VLGEPPEGVTAIPHGTLDESVGHRPGPASRLSTCSRSEQSCAASSSTSPTPAVPQQRPSLSQNPGRSLCGTPEVRIEWRHRSLSSRTSWPRTSGTPARSRAANRYDVPAGPWHQVYVTGSTSRTEAGMVCGTTKPSSANEATESRCRAPSTAASTKSRRRSAAPATASALATPAVPCEKFGIRDDRPRRMPQSSPAPVRSAASSRASPPAAATVPACAPPTHTAVSTTPAVPVTTSVSGASEPSRPEHVRQPSDVLSSRSRCSTGS